MKKLFLLTLMTLCLCFPHTASATNYLNDDPNFPQTGGRLGYGEYTDLNSCQITEETNQYYDIAVGYVLIRPNQEDSYRIRKFRYWKDGIKRPQFFNQKKEVWVDIPKQPNAAEADAFRRNTPNYNIGLYTAHFKTNLFHCLQAVLQHSFGIELVE